MRAEARQSTIRDLLNDAIRHVVADAVHDGGIVRTGPSAIRLANTYPNSGLSPEEIAEEIIRTAISAGVATEISRPE